MKRSTVAPVGMALMFLSLAVVPFSINGSGPGLDSRFHSLTNAWSQIASVFLTVYQPSSAAQLLALEYTNKDEDHQACSAQQVAALDSPDVPIEFGDTTLSEAKQPELSLAKEMSAVTETPIKCTKVPASLPAKRVRPALTSRRVAAGPIYVPLIDLSGVIKLAVQSEQVTKLIDRHLADYKMIQAKFELSKLGGPSSIPARPAAVVKRGTSGCSDAFEGASGPRLDLRERPRRIRLSVPAGTGVQS